MVLLPSFEFQWADDHPAQFVVVIRIYVWSRDVKIIFVGFGQGCMFQVKDKLTFDFILSKSLRGSAEAEISNSKKTFVD